MSVRVQRERFQPGAELDCFQAGVPAAGAVTSFTGSVRGQDTDSGLPIAAMTLEHYPGMTTRQLEAIEVEARRRWPLLDVLIIHRYGRLEAGEPIVLVCTASSHREAAFAACSFLMDWLKTKAPFWKQEETPEGSRWVEAKDSDDARAAAWDHD